MPPGRSVMWAIAEQVNDEEAAERDASVPPEAEPAKADEPYADAEDAADAPATIATTAAAFSDSESDGEEHSHDSEGKPGEEPADVGVPGPVRVLAVLR